MYVVLDDKLPKANMNQHLSRPHFVCSLCHDAAARFQAISRDILFHKSTVFSRSTAVRRFFSSTNSSRQLSHVVSCSRSRVRCNTTNFSAPFRFDRIFSGLRSRWYGSNSKGRGGGSKKGAAIRLAAAASGCMLSTEDEKEPDYLAITVRELERAVDDVKQCIQWYYGGSSKGEEKMEGWSLVSKTPQYAIWSRPLNNGSSILEYKVKASYDDIPPIVFLFVQMDLEGRSTWDPSTDLVERIDTVDSNSIADSKSTSTSTATTSTDILYWRVNFPRPMAKRDYVFLRSCLIDPLRNVLVLVSKSLPTHESRPPTAECVRVTNYSSQMIIRPQHTFLQDGFDYVLTYYDDTKIKMPSYAYKRLVQSNLPTFMASVHREARALHTEYKKYVESGEAGLNEAPSRIQALHQLILRAKQQWVESIAAIEANTFSTAVPTLEPADNDTQLSVETDDGSWRQNIPIQKITPPQYLPDVAAFLRQLVSEGKLGRPQLKCYHQNNDSVQRLAYPAYGRSKRDTIKTYPSYNTTASTTCTASTTAAST